MLGKKVECRPVWKPMHKQPVYNELYELRYENENGTFGTKDVNENEG